MGFLVKLFFLISTVLIGYAIHQLLQVPPLPQLEDVWWGPRDATKEDTSIKPFKINVSDEVLKDLKLRLQQARPFVPPLEGVQHQYGLNTNLLKKFVDYWLTKYDWREREKFLNQFPQYKVSVQGLQLHYLHVKPKNPGNLKVYPLLILHGWPGSVREFYEIIPLLTTPQKGRDFVFEVIAPSLPGYGFSEAAVKPGLSALHVAVLFKNFMKRLGFDKYYLQGGDWGGVIVQHMSVLYPERVLGVHSNMCFVNTRLSNLKTFIGSFIPQLVVDKEHAHLMYPLSEKFANILLESGYLHLQATKPDTVGVGLNDSPVGLAAYILEKFITWTNPDWKNYIDGKLTERFDYTKLLDNIMIYWVTNSITTSVRLYSETFNKAHFSLGVDQNPINVPSACARFKHELVYQSTCILSEKFKNLVHVSDLDGGHFAAFEVPNVLANDIYDSVAKMIEFGKTANKK
uniref:Epoxide hydrolase n=1 Tax=Epicauta chinensis TaxID=941254 RepID=A0A2C9DK11_9CUCU|nr:juvenile hormone epoxide hydrolase [Epicauta chinensis]